MKMLSRFRKIDMFGRKVELRLERKKTHKTYCGAVMTLLVVFLISIIVLLFSQQYIRYDNPFLRTYSISMSDEITFDVDLQIGIRGTTPDFPQIHRDTAVLVSNHVKISDSTGEITYSPLEMMVCEGSNSFACLSPNQQVNILPFNGSDFYGQDVSYIEFLVFDCISYARYSGTSAADCQSESEIRNTLSRGVEGILQFHKFEVKPMDFDSPISTQVKKFKRTIDQTLEVLDVTFEQLSVTTDHGVFFEDRIETIVTSFEKRSINTSSSANVSERFPANTTPLKILRIFISNQRQCVDRTYSKVQVYLANIRGIIKMLMVFGEFIIGPFVRLSLNTKIVNEVFEFEGGEVEEEDITNNQEIFDLYQEENLHLHPLNKSPEQLNPNNNNSSHQQNSNNNNNNNNFPQNINLSRVASPSNAGLIAQPAPLPQQPTNKMFSHFTNPPSLLGIGNFELNGLKRSKSFIKSASEIKENRVRNEEEQLQISQNLTDQQLSLQQMHSYKQLSPLRIPTQQRMSCFRKQSTDRNNNNQQNNDLTEDLVINVNENNNIDSQTLPAILDHTDDSHATDSNQSDSCESADPAGNVHRQYFVESHHDFRARLPGSMNFNSHNESKQEQKPAFKFTNIFPSLIYPGDQLPSKSFDGSRRSSINTQQIPFPLINLNKQTSKSDSSSPSTRKNTANLNENTSAQERVTEIAVTCPKINFLNQNPEEADSEAKTPSLLEAKNNTLQYNHSSSLQRRPIDLQNSSLLISTPKQSFNAGVNRFTPQQDLKSPSMRRNGSRKFSIFEKQKIFALTKLMDNYQNQMETPANALKDYKQLVGSPKWKTDNEDSIFNRLVSQGKKMQFKFFDFILYHLQCFNKMYSEKKKQIRFSKQKVKERLDVVYIIQKLVEVDKLKMLLLNEDQLKLFEYLPKPIVHLNPKEPQTTSNDCSQIQLKDKNTLLETWSMLHQQKKSIVKAVEASKVYSEMMQRGQDALSEMDLKLISMLDFRMKEIFNLNDQMQKQKEHRHNQSPPHQFGILKLQSISNNNNLNCSSNQANNETQVKLMEQRPTTIADERMNAPTISQFTHPKLISLDKIPSLNNKLFETNFP